MLNKLEKLNGTSIELSIQKSAIYEELKDEEKSIAVLLEVLEIDSLDIRILDRLVNLYINQKNNSQAIIYNKQIIDLFPEDHRGHINQAIIAMGNKSLKMLYLA